MLPLEIAGNRYGRLTAQSLIPRRIKNVSRRFWTCICDCGSSVTVSQSSLTSGNGQSCGCLKIDRLATHLKSKTPEYRVWAGIIQRCTNPNNRRFQDYGGRGITVCDQWLSFENFLQDMGTRPSKDFSIERIDNESGYRKSNCKWATRSEQQRNKRTSPQNRKMPC